MKVDVFFGIPMDQEYFDIDVLTDQIGIKNSINKSKAVVRLTEEAGRSNPIVQIAKRQTILKHLKPLIGSNLKPYDSLYYKKEVNTADKGDRAYNCEEKLLQFCLVIATGEPYKALVHKDFKPNIQALRGTPQRERFDRYWGILADATRDSIEQYRENKKRMEEEEGVEAGNGEANGEGGFWNKLFTKKTASK